MEYELAIYIIPFGLAVGCLCIPFYFLRKVTDTRLQVGLLLWTAPVLIWAIASLMRLSVTTIPQERFWYTVRFVGPAVGSVGYFLFTAAYTTRMRWFRPWRLLGSLLVPLITLVLVSTNSAHQLVWASVSPAATGPFVMTVMPGPWFIVHAIYSYVLILVGTAWLGHRLWEFRERTFYRGQIATVLLAVVVVLAANLSSNLGVTAVDWTPVAGAVATVLFVGAASEYRLFDLSPLAREIVVENMDSGMLVTDADAEIVDANSRAAMILDAEVSDLIGAALDTVFMTSNEAIEELLNASEPTETIRVDHEDAVRYYDISVSPITGPSNAYLGRVIIFSDVTARVGQRSRLRTQKEQLERQTERLERFTSVVSHDLRNPLAVITGRLELARETGDTEHFDAIERSAARMETILEETLTLARAGETVDELESLDLARLVRRSWKGMRTDGCELEVEIPDDVTVRADRNRLLQVFENLFRNARDHNDSPVTVRVGMLDDSHADDIGSGGFFIEDSGSGIPASDRDGVFQQGYTTSGTGTGFGLAIVEDIIAAHSWEISVTESATGGARFEITQVDLATEQREYYDDASEVS